MKIIIVACFCLMKQISFAQVKFYTCVNDSAFLNFLNSQNYRNFDYDIFFQSQKDKSFRQSCLSKTASSKILSLLKNEGYDFKSELNYEKQSLKIQTENKARELSEKDTLKYRFILDSLYSIKLSQALERFKLKDKSSISPRVVYFVGEIYFYEAIPFLENYLNNPQSKYNKEEVKLVLARLGCKKYYDDYLSKLKIPASTYQDYDDKAKLIWGYSNLNTNEALYTFFVTELKNNNLVDTPFDCNQGCSKMMPVWYSVVDDLHWFSLFKVQQIEKFGKTLSEMNEKERRTEKVRKGLLEIIESNKNIFPIDNRNK